MSLANNTFGSQLTYDGLSFQYKYYYKPKYFPELLKNKTVPDSDKAYIRNMLTKPWNLYIFRHSALTEKSRILTENVLRDHAGWSMTSHMPQVYIHYFGTESSRSLLQARGFIKEQDSREYHLQPRQCPNCREGNKPEAKFCAKCRMVLTYDAYSETLENQKVKENRLTVIENQMSALLTTLGNFKDQNQLNQSAKMLYDSGILGMPSSKSKKTEQT